MKYEIVSELEGIDNPQYYSGHGHSFENNLVSCLQFQLGVFDPSSLDDFKYWLESAINGSEWFDNDVEGIELDKELEKLKGLSVSELFSEQELISWFEEMKYQYKEFIDANQGEDLEDLDMDLYLYGYLHIYKVEGEN